MPSKNSPRLPGLPLRSQHWCHLEPHTAGLIQVPGSLGPHCPPLLSAAGPSAFALALPGQGFHRTLQGSNSLSRTTSEAVRLCTPALPPTPLASFFPLTTTLASPLQHPTMLPQDLWGPSWPTPLASYLELSRDYPLVYPVPPPSPSSGMQLWHRWGIRLFCSRLHTHLPAQARLPCK